MHLVTRILFILCALLYSVSNICVYSHVHTHTEEHTSCHEDHQHHNDDNCSICFYQHTPNAILAFDFTTVPTVYSFEFAIDYLPYARFNEIKTHSSSTNKDPPASLYS